VNHETLTQELFQEIGTTIKICFTISIFLLWIKFIDYIRMTHSLGVLIKIIQLMFKDLLSFLVILGLIYLAFASIFYILYKSSYAEFETFLLSIRQMFSSSLGTFVFFNEGSNFNKFSLSLITVVYMLLTNIVLLNLLIAILSNTYSVIIARSNTEYALILHESYQTLKFNKKFGAILLYPPPLSVVSFLVLPLVLRARSEKINQIILKSAYSLFLLIFSIAFSIVNLFFVVPLAYIRIFIKIILCNYINKKALTFSIRLNHLCTWIFLGIPYLFYMHFTHDLVVFCKAAYMKIDNREKLKDISYVDYRLLKKIYREGIDSNKLFIETEEFYKKFTNNLIQSGLIEEEKQDQAVKVVGDLNVPKVKLEKRFTVVDSPEGKEAVNRALELEIMEAKNFIKNFAVDGQIKLAYLEKYFSILRMKKKRTGNSSKKYPHLLEIVSLEKSVSGLGSPAPT
jgi:hypothetical protein